MVWRVAVLSARCSSGARPFAAVCRFVSSQVWQIIHPLLSVTTTSLHVLYILSSILFTLPSLLCPTLNPSPLWFIQRIGLACFEKLVLWDCKRRVKGQLMTSYETF